MTAAALGVRDKNTSQNLRTIRFRDDYYNAWTNPKLHELYEAIDFLQRIIMECLRWLGNVVHMKEVAPTKKDFEAKADGAWWSRWPWNGAANTLV